MKPSFRSCLLRIIVAASALLTVAQAADSKSPLVKVADIPMQRARVGAAIAPLGDYLYIFGGSGGGAPIYDAERLDLRTGKTEKIDGTFLARRYHGAFEYQGKFYLVGGDGYALPGRSHEDNVEVYDPATGKVSLIEKMPRPRARFGVVKIGNEAWLVGGTKHKEGRSYSQTNEVEIFDLAKLEWRKGPPMPTPRDAPVVVVGAFAVVAGGYASGTTLDEVEMWVPTEQVWKHLPKLGQPVSSHSAAFLGRWLFLFGSHDVGDQVLAYELSTRKTTKISPGFLNTRRSIAITLGDRIYVVGGEAVDTGPAGGRNGGHVANSGNTTYAGSERATIQVFELNPDYKPAP
ncbi:MAG: hypothetical protein HZA32_00580 [Opitutae bacterium]|nr:hypothetical protein [Opitutae bacterium]